MALTLSLSALGATSMAALAGGAAVAGAIGLGIAGLAVLSTGGPSNTRRRQRGRAGNRQGSYYQQSYRGKRTVREQSAAVQNLLQVIRQEDVTGCGLKLVCELAGLKREELGTEEQAILDLIGPVVPPGEGLMPSGGARDYVLAKAFGQQQGNCTHAFPNCHIYGSDIMATVMNYLP